MHPYLKIVRYDMFNDVFDEFRIFQMVKERQDEMNQAENEYNVEHVQDRFPNDDLELNEKERSVIFLKNRILFK